MPLYTFQNEKTGESKDVFFHMNDKKEYLGENGDEDCWRRVFYSPQAIIDSDSSIDPFSAKEFIGKTGNKRDSAGKWWDRSEELSKKRAEKNGGVDPIRVKAEQEYSKKRNGKPRPQKQKDITITI